jgi:hypothetical protein
LELQQDEEEIYADWSMKLLVISMRKDQVMLAHIISQHGLRECGPKVRFLVGAIRHV